MSKEFREIGFRFLKSIYYMETPKKITKKFENVSNDRLGNIMLFLRNKRLINIKNFEEGPPWNINLTDRGVEYVASELSRRRQDQLNIWLVAATVVSAIATAFLAYGVFK